MKITESEFREIIRQKLSEKRSLISEQSAPAAPQDKVAVKIFRNWVNTGAGSPERKRMLRDIYSAANLQDDFLSYTGENLSGTNSYFKIAWRLFGSDYNADRRRDTNPAPDEATPAEATPAEAPPTEEAQPEAAPAGDKKPEEKPSNPSEQMGVSSDGESEGEGLVAIPVNYVGTSNKAFDIMMPKTYERYTGDGSAFNSDKAVAKINKHAGTLPANKREFKIAFGNYVGRPDGSMFQPQFGQLDKINKIMVETDLKINQIKGSGFWDVYKAVRGVERKLKRNRNRIPAGAGLNAKVGAIQSILESLRVAMEKEDYDRLIVRQEGKDYKRFRFAENNPSTTTNPKNIRRLIDNIYMDSGFASHMDSKIDAAKKQSPGARAKTIKDDIVEYFVNNILVDTDNSLGELKESKAPEREIANIIRDIVTETLKKKD